MSREPLSKLLPLFSLITLVSLACNLPYLGIVTPEAVIKDEENNDIDDGNPYNNILYGQIETFDDPMVESKINFQTDTINFNNKEFTFEEYLNYIDSRVAFNEHGVGSVYQEALVNYLEIKHQEAFSDTEYGVYFLNTVDFMNILTHINEHRSDEEFKYNQDVEFKPEDRSTKGFTTTDLVTDNKNIFIHVPDDRVGTLYPLIVMLEGIAPKDTVAEDLWVSTVHEHFHTLSKIYSSDEFSNEIKTELIKYFPEVKPEKFEYMFGLALGYTQEDGVIMKYSQANEGFTQFQAETYLFPEGENYSSLTAYEPFEGYFRLISNKLSFTSEDTKIINEKGLIYFLDSVKFRLMDITGCSEEEAISKTSQIYEKFETITENPIFLDSERDSLNLFLDGLLVKEK